MNRKSPQPRGEKYYRSRQSRPPRLKNNDIAIIGMACRFPGARNYKEFWQNLKDERSSIQEIPRERWDWKTYWGDPQAEHNKSNSKWGGFIEDVDAFDLGFFGLSAREAEAMDPQQRIILELSWSCFEDAGILPSQVSGKQIGVYIGVFNFDYKELQEKGTRTIETYHSTGTAPAVIPNRISHFFHLKGPSFAIDTACSSSLYAIHSAVQSLHEGECDMALAGGVSLLLTPTRHISFSKTGMLSPTGSCKTFDDDADGYVRSEGAGLILLKPLENAIKDRDTIYGLLKGSAVNHSGKTHTLTYPNPEAQADVIIQAYKRAGITPESIGYVEAHGTGTPKGDPLEFQGLQKAFRYFASETDQENKKNYCGLGSVKSNIGHLESAAGIAGVIKVLLSMKYKQLPALQNFKQLNQHISIKDSPFYIVDHLRAWKPRKGGDNQILPRRAGVSSFGFGGTNAHVVLEEAPDTIEAGTKKLPYYLICLSAKTQDALKQREQDLAYWLKQEGRKNKLFDISATLLLNREHFLTRVCYVVRDVQELQDKINKILVNEKTEGCFRGGNANKRKPEKPLFKTLGRTILKELRGSPKIDGKGYRDKLLVLAELYADGFDLDWKAMFTNDIKPRRISLPTYPFARERYWIPEAGAQGAGDRGQESGDRRQVIHPLLHQNTSDLSEQRFSSTFTGREFFLSDHVVQGRKILPGVAYLEMARAAVDQSARGFEVGFAGIQLKNITWARPIIVRDVPVHIRIGLRVEDDGEIAYEIYSESEPGAGRVVHSQGKAMLCRLAEVSPIDIKALQTQCTQSSLSAARCYETFKAMGIEYGPAHQGIEEVYRGTGQILAKLSLPLTVVSSQEQFCLHPSMLDAALQSCFMLDPGDLTLRLPFALRELEIIKNCTSSMWAWVREAPGETVQKLDIDLCDEYGNVCVRMKGFSTKALEGEIQTSRVPDAVIPESSIDPLVGTVTLVPVWETVPEKRWPASPSTSDQVAIVGGEEDARRAIRQYCPKTHDLDIHAEDTIETITRKLKELGSFDHIVWITPHHSLQSPVDDAVIEDQQQGVLKLFRTIKALLRSGYGTRDVGWTVITTQAQFISQNDPEKPANASIHGLVGSMAKEYPNWKTRLIDWETDGDRPLSDIFTLPPDPRGNAWAHRAGEWYRQQLIPVRRPFRDKTLYKTGGTYVVIGGAGGIGEVWSEYMIRTYQARIVWIGRRQKDSAIQAKLDKLAAIGPTPDYLAADATNRESLKKAYEEIKARHSHIHGVIHSAIVLQDQGLANMGEERFKAALSAKVDVSVRMAQVFQKEPLDFVLFFSSINSFAKPAGQSNYTAGCTFKDAYARALSRQWRCAVKVMNWGYWGSVGVVSSHTYQERMAQAGIGSIEPLEAMEALETLLTGPMDQIALVNILRPAALEEVSAEEFFTVYPENFSSPTQSINGEISRLPDVSKRFSTTAKSKSRGGGLQMKEMEDIIRKLLRCQLRIAGLTGELVHNQTNTADLMRETGLHRPYDKWLKESLAILKRGENPAGDGNISSTEDSVVLDSESIWKEWDLRKRLWLENPNTRAHVVLAEKMLRALPDILLGKTLATDIMFPDSSMELVERLYKDNAVADYFNGMIADTVVSIIRDRLQQDPSARIRIIEIGAGTGGTSAVVFRKIKPYQDHIQEYCYTDISRAFLWHAEKEYGPLNSSLNYKIFNVEAPVAEQGIEKGGYDIAIATNVLHATKNIRQTLRNTKAVLKKSGLILLNELSGSSLFLHVTFGLLEGWWLFEDQALRMPGCPVLAPQTWSRVLGDEGFRTVLFPAQEAHALGQQIVIAESDGIVRQRQQHTMEAAPKRSAEKEHRPPARGMQKNRPALVQERFDVADQIIMDHVKQIIIEKLSKSLKVDQSAVSVDEPFADYGLDSITGTHVVQLINKTLGIELETTRLFDYSSVNQLTAYILSQHKDVIAKALGQKKMLPDSYDDSNRAHKDERRPPFLYSTRFRRQALSVPDADPTEKQRKDPLCKEPIAVIGMSGRFPKSRTAAELWKHLANGTNLVEQVSRWDMAKYYPAGTNYCNYGGFLDHIEEFDPLVFNISGIEATYMDPQQRIFLEESWKALEDAGYAGSGVHGRLCGVYVGCVGVDYRQLFGQNPPAQAFWGNAGSVIPARVAYYLNLKGPAIAIDTACSGSLVAVHLACQGLWTGETEMALAGGVVVQCTPGFYLNAERAGMLSHTGCCHAFDDRADGFVPAEGAGVVVLKRLRDAIDDGDHIYGVIRGSGINQDGATNGITAPSANSQEQLERSVYDAFHINPEQIQMMEAHGTGTKLGDPIEYQALTQAFRNYTEEKEYCAIGTIKSNLGHALSAAGVAGLIKVLLSLRHKKIPPSLHFQSGNSSIQFAGSPFYVNTRLRDWEIGPNSRRCAAISSFGFSGTNAHMVIEEPPVRERRHPENPAYLIVVSARTKRQLRRQVEQLVEHCERNSPVDIGNISFTLLMGRKHFNHRLASVVRNLGELVVTCKKWLETGKAPQITVSELSEDGYREQPSLKRYGNQCIQACQRADQANDYVEHLSAIAELYAQGYTLEFGQLFTPGQYFRISLPTYPFSNERYWVSGIKNTLDISTRAASESFGSRENGTGNRAVSFLKKKWELCPSTSSGGMKRTIAIMTTPETRELAARLSGLFPNSQILDTDAQSPLTSPEHQWKTYDGFIDLTGCGKENTESMDWIAWLQKLIEQGHKEGILLLCVTKGLESYQNAEVNISGASRVGLYRMLQSEYGHVRSRHMDADPSGDEGTLASQIASELLAESEETEVCYRNGQRYRAFLEEVQGTESEDRTFAFPEGHVLWITGGTRGLGSLCARHFVTRYGVKRLVLTGRDKMPPRDEWHAYREQDTLLARKIQAVQALESLGAEVRVLSVSLTDSVAVQESVRAIKQSMGPLGGFIHCAGIADFENPAFIRKSSAGIRQVLNPKVAGLDILYECLQNEPLKFCILFSSVSSVIPTLASGHSDYAMANAYMDYFAEATASALPIVSIQWPSWEETDMGGKIKSRAYQETGLLSHTNREGFQLLDTILSGKLGPVVLPAVINRDNWKPHKLMQRRIHTIPAKTIQPQRSTIPDASNGSADLRNATQKWLISLISHELQIDPSNLDIETPFQDFGMDSILLAQVITKIDRELQGSALEPSALIDHPSIKSLSYYLTQTYPEALTSLFPFKVAENKNADQRFSQRRTISNPEHKNDQRESRESNALHPREKIAVVGMACHFPDAADIGTFWENLKSGKDSIREVPKFRWEWEKYYSAGDYQDGKSISKWGAFLEHIEEFDPGYFKIPDHLAPKIDPLQRQWLEVSVEALADAGYGDKDLWGKQVGVFVGTRTGNFASKLDRAEKDVIIGTGQNFIAAHLAHIYNFKGPNLVIDTACSSSLTAIHMAVKSIQIGESEIAVAGGVDILLDESVFLVLSAAKILSPEGRCKTFDAAADGIGVGEGCGVLILKPLGAAIRDNNKIYGVIDGSAINSDGNTMGVTTPNPEAQRALIETVIKNADINPETITYVETHGTGTLIGDPIELKALTQVFSEHTSKKQFCGVGSVKSNIGHLLSAAGAASIIKVLLAIIHQELPPTLHCSNPNPRFNFDTSPLYIVQDVRQWTGENGILRAGISAFGLGGNNAHIIVSNEGIPPAHVASREPRGNTVTFRRKVFWPQKTAIDMAVRPAPKEDGDFMKMFKIVEV